MRLSRFAAACLCLALLALGAATPSGALSEDRACAWVGSNEVCVPPR